ncbi:MAG: SOS response-associated peptidase [Limnochordales bacterium]|nr:SOS response-associated peptidase [Limnochordales bacterium]
MCARYTLTDTGELLLRQFRLAELPAGYRPRYNIAPTQAVTVVLNGQQRRAAQFRWGLIPFWAKDASIGRKLINARAETVAVKPSFRHSLRRRRCLIPADGFYEWQAQDGRKQPLRIVPATQTLLAFAGLWDRWQSPEGEEVYSCVIITTAANGFMRPIHDRMPAILSPADYDLWLDPDVQEPEAVTPLLRPCPDDMLRAYPVSTVVNSPRNDTPACIAPLPQ